MQGKSRVDQSFPLKIIINSLSKQVKVFRAIIDPKRHNDSVLRDYLWDIYSKYIELMFL